MPATKRKHIVEKTAKELNMSADDIDDIVYSYYNHVLKLINSLEHTRIYVNNVCIFKFRMMKSMSYIEYGTKTVHRLRLRKPTEYLLAGIEEIETRTNKLKKLIEALYQEGDMQSIKRKDRYEFIKSVENQKSNPGGDIE